MKRITFLLLAVVTVAGVVAFVAPASGHADGGAAPIYGVKLPPGYRDWRWSPSPTKQATLTIFAPFLATI
jgi:hypothetical protein